uniref:Uncharacterized protein n=1 Tax=Pyrodinium bahamense TaxID=73915 RepID=A0A7S0FS88_9DINO
MAGVLVALLALSAGPWQCSAARTAAAGATSADGVQTPVTRVVKLLQGLALKTKMEGQAEEDLYEKFVCWGKSIIDTKTASNAAAQARIESLEDYIKDIEAGRITFTTEEADLTKEIYTLGKDIDTSTDLRAQEHGQFLEAEDEMEKAIAALTGAIKVLQEATAGHETGTLLVQRAGDRVGEGFAARAADADTLQHAVELGQRALSAGDAVFLRRLLTGDVPTPQWQKLNRKATYKMSYKARSFKIQATLTKLNETFTASLSEAEAREAEARASYDKLMVSKNAQKSETEEALRKLEKEHGARQMSQEEAEDEVQALTTQISNDNRFIEQTKEELATKKAEHKVRYTLRTNEIAAMQKAIQILYNDDARDLMKRSFTSQGYYSLVQEHSEQGTLASDAAKRRLHLAAELLQKTAHAGRDTRVATLASQVATHSSGPFDEVFQAIDSMVETLKEEEVSDLHNKEECEKNRADSTRTAAKTAREMDEATDDITKLEAEIDDIKAEVKEKDNLVKETRADMDAATKIREADHQEWTASDADDKEMAVTVRKAARVLEEFYSENNLVLVQQPEAVAGQAPPPPPKTWEGGYQGKTDLAKGILETLAIIEEDIKKDIRLAKEAEDNAASQHTTYMTESQEQIKALEDDIATLTGTKGEKQNSVSGEKSLRLEKKTTLASVLQMISDANAGCEYITVNYQTRLRNRQIEIDGLRKAKAILAGGRFNPGPDPNRPLEPGDALFLQRHLK